MTSTKFILVPMLSFLCFASMGCTTPMRKPLSSITSNQLEQKGLIVGHLSLHDSKTESKLGGFFGTNFVAYATRVGENKKVYEVWVENKDNGYFGWLLEPGTYWIHYCRIKDMNQETSLEDWSPQIQVKAGEITYAGHIHYEIGKTYFGKTMKKIFTSGVKENLKDTGGLLVEAEQQVSNNQEDMKNYLESIGLGKFPLKARIVESWKYIPQ